MAKIAFITFYDQQAIGIRVLGSYLKQQGHECLLVFLKNFEHKPMDAPFHGRYNSQVCRNGKIYAFNLDEMGITDCEKRLAIDQIVEFKPDVIGISSRSFFDDLIGDFVSLLREKTGETLIVAGGFGPFLNPDKWLESVDLIVRGDGEEAMSQIMRNVDKRQGFKSIPNVCYKKENKIVCNKLLPPAKDLSLYPAPLLPSENSVYIENNSVLDYDDKVYFILMGRGCVGSCSYCSGGNLPTLYSKEGLFLPKRRMRTVDSIINELVDAKSLGAESVLIMDEFLVASKEKLTRVFTEYRDKVGLPFSAYVHPEIIKIIPDFVDLLIEGGLKRTVVGIQSGDEDFCKEIYSRRQNNEDLIEFATAMNRAGVAIDYHFIGGNPLESTETFERTLDLISRLPFDPSCDAIQSSFFTPFPKSPIVERFGFERLRGYDLRRWYREGILHYLRAVCSDEQFTVCRNIKNTDELIDFTVDMCVDSGLRGIEITPDANFGPEIRKRILEKCKGRKVYLWGTGERYEELKGVLDGISVQAVFDNDASKHGEFLDGNVPVISPAKMIDMEKLPVLVCSSAVKAINKDILNVWPDAVIINLDKRVSAAGFY